MKNSFGHILCSKEEAGIHCDGCGKPLKYREPIAENGKKWFHEECFEARKTARKSRLAFYRGSL